MKTKQSIRLIPAIFSILLPLFFSSTAFSQVAKTELQIDDDNLFDIKVELKDDRYTVSMDPNGEEVTNSITVTNFTSFVLNSFIQITLKQKKIVVGDKNSLDQKINLIYIELIAALYNTQQEGQQIATIKLNESVKLWVHNKEAKAQNHSKFEETSTIHLKSAQVVFEEGFIKSIIIAGEGDNKTYYFSNHYPIGITTRQNILKLSTQHLYNESEDAKEYIVLSEAIVYKRELGLRTNDYSPADDVVYLNPSMENGIKLYKSPSPEIFTLNIFSDFVGINENNPNGLIQTEFSKRININTTRHRLGKSAGIGYFTHLLPVFELSKIEQNNRQMPLLNQSTDTSNTNYANPLQVLRYSTINVRTELNLIDIHGSVVSMHIEALAGVAVTYVQDSSLINNKPVFMDETINTFAFGTKAKFILNPESKWSYIMTGTYLRINNLNDKFIYRTIRNGELYNSSNNLYSGELLVTWNTSDDNKLFGRFRFNLEGGNEYNNYSEFQIGFSKKFKSAK